MGNSTQHTTVQDQNHKRTTNLQSHFIQTDNKNRVPFKRREYSRVLGVTQR